MRKENYVFKNEFIRQCRPSQAQVLQEWIFPNMGEN
jgi:hypothetical protein